MSGTLGKAKEDIQILIPVQGFHNQVPCRTPNLSQLNTTVGIDWSNTVYAVNRVQDGQEATPRGIIILVSQFSIHQS